MAWMIGVDVGGTFTDFFAFDDADDRIVLHKVASTPANPAQAVIAGLRELGATHGIDLAAITRLSHGTTVATNALIQRRGGKVALVLTEGFRDLIEIGRQIRPHVFSLQDDYPAPLVPPMSSEMTSGRPESRAMWIAPTAPAAGPESAVRIGTCRARATDISPPDDWLMPSAALGAASLTPSANSPR